MSKNRERLAALVALQKAAAELEDDLYHATLEITGDEPVVGARYAFKSKFGSYEECILTDEVASPDPLGRVFAKTVVVLTAMPFDSGPLKKGEYKVRTVVRESSLIPL